MNKQDLTLLGRIYDAEINGKLPAQINSKHMPRLQSAGLVTPMEVTYPGRFPITIHGWELTHLGRFEFCSSCEGGDKA